MGQNPKTTLAILLLAGIIDRETADRFNAAFNRLSGQKIPWNFEELLTQIEGELDA